MADLHKLLAENDQRLSSEMHSLAGEASKVCAAMAQHAHAP